MPLPAIIFGSLFALLLVAVVLVVLNAVRRSRRGDDRIQLQGWQRLADGSDVMAGWDGWPFLIALEAGKVSDIVVGELEGVEFMSLRWSQLEPPHGGGPAGDVERYNMVAVRCETPVPPFSVVRGEHKVKTWERHEQAQAFEVGESRFDRRWQTLGDAGAGRALLVPEARAVVDEVDLGAWVFQPGWAVRVIPWTFWGGEDRMVEEVHRAVAPWRHVPAETWAAYGGPPRFVTTSLGEGPGGGPAAGGSPETGPGRGWD
ncbi:hypothetical protein [Nocardioides marmoraquaticus]